MVAPYVLETSAGPGWIELDRPPRARGVLALTHGAGGGVASADVVAIRMVLLDAGFAVALVTQPYRVAGRGAPPRPAVQDPAWVELITGLRGRRGFSALPLVVGGRSNGARLACRTAKEVGAVAVVALAFPLHPPGKPEVSRRDELDLPEVPVLVVQGDRDPFGMPEPGPQRDLVVVAGADHSLKRDVDAVARAVLEFITSDKVIP